MYNLNWFLEVVLNTLNCNYELFARNIVSSENCCLVDDQGKQYIDFESGVWCVSLGHNCEQVNEAMINQMKAISHVGSRYSTQIVEEAAGKVLKLLNFNDGKCVFLASGSEAVEFGVQLAKQVMCKPFFLCFRNYFLSSYGISASRDNTQWISLDLSEYSGNAVDYLRDVPFGEIGAFVFEPGNASGTVKLPPAGLVKAIEDRVKENKGFVIVDEVTTGAGRTGKWFGFEHYNIRPDIVSLGKGIGNGYPVSVISVSKQVAELAEQGGFKYAQSHQNDPLGCAAVSEVISVIEENRYIQRSADIGLVLETELNSLRKKHNCIKEVRGIGLMYVVEFSSDNKESLEIIHRELFEAGYVTGISVLANLLRFYPPLTIEETHIKGMVNALDAILVKYCQ